MKKLFLTLLFSLGCVGLVGSGMAAGGANSGRTCSPTNISYCKQGRTFLGSRYKSYTVRCSDGTRRSITAWDNRKTWCVGMRSQCTNDQLKAAKMACKGRS